MNESALPRSIDWQLTYACQLRCTHCYTESGRRASRKLSREELLRIADIFVAMRVRSVQLGGGEPLLLPEIFDIADRLVAGGIDVDLYTNGIDVTGAGAPDIVRHFPEVHVSVDGATAAVHDVIRGRPGAFDAAVQALGALDRAASARRRTGDTPFWLGIDVVVVQSNFAQMEQFCSTFVRAFPALSSISFGAAVPSGLATRERYAEEELLTEEQLAVLRDPGFAARLRALAPSSVQVTISDNFCLQMSPQLLRDGKAATDVMEIEPDGGVRGMLIYEGVVGNILHEPPEVLWQRAKERVNDPFVVRELSSATTMKAWATAARHIDQRFGSRNDLRRISRRGEEVSPRARALEE